MTKQEMPVEQKPKSPSECCHGNHILLCKEIECINELSVLEDSAYCPHGFLVGCPTCTTAETTVITTKLHSEIVECLNKVQLLANTAGDAYYRFKYMKTVKEPLNKILAELGEAK